MEPKTILDHGYCSCVESWGSDERIIEAARMSTQKGFLGWEQDSRLLRYLWEHKHHTPFEMGGLTIEVQAPIFVFREWHRHRTQSYNELSARYTELPDLFYVPSIPRLMGGKQGQKNKQGSEDGFDPGTAEVIRETIEDACIEARRTYEGLLASGVSREIARLVIPVSQYSRMRASANLRNWLAFLSLRMAPGAQWEIRQYANAISNIIAEVFPRTHSLFMEAQ
jgi:thymidylate synthase (FAD)